MAKSNPTVKSPEKKSLVQELGRIIFVDRMANSVYNDEYYQNCESPDYNKAYNLLLRTKEIVLKELEETFTQRPKGEDRGSQDIEYTGLDLLKMVLRGDFDDQYKKTSSNEKNFQAALALWEATKKIPGLWDEKSPIAKDDPRHKDHDFWLKVRLSDQSLSEVVGDRINDIGYSPEEEVLRAAYGIGEKLKKSKQFQNTTRGWETKAITEKLNHENMEEYEKILFLAQVEKAASIARKKEFDKVASIQDWSVRSATVRYITKGQSGDTTFDEIVSRKRLIALITNKPEVILE